jgi:antirestriction protein ArdC
MASEDPSKFSVYAALTAKIVRAMALAGSWRMPWHTQGRALSMPINAATRNPYRGVNVLSLWADAMGRGYSRPHWASYRQWQGMNAQVRSGERGSMIVFYRKLEPSDNEHELTDLPHYLARAYWVFNIAQVDGAGEEPPSPGEPVATDEKLDAFVQATGARVRDGSVAARYRTDLDLIEMPDRGCFRGTRTSTSTQAYYGVLLHELTHWTGAAHRLDRQFGKRFGDNAYAFEELVAELGAAFLCAAFGIANEPRPDHAAYLAAWLNVLKQDQRAIFTASGKAQEAIEFLSHTAAIELDPLQKAS